MKPAAQTKIDDRWVAAVAAEVEGGLRRRLEAVRRQGGAPADLGSPADVAARMVAAVPEPSPWRALGPFYSTKGVARVLGGITRQGVDDRRRRGRIVALRTTDGTWVHPSFQFDAHNRPIAGLAEAFTILTDAYDEWTAAAALLGPQPELGRRSIRDFLLDGGAVDDVRTLCRAAVARWRS